MVRLNRIVAARRLRGVIRHNHEAYDGSGYPGGLAGDEIPLAARAVATCHAFRRHDLRPPIPARLAHEAGDRDPRGGSGSPVGPDLVPAFIELAVPAYKQPSRTAGFAGAA